MIEMKDMKGKKLNEKSEGKNKINEITYDMKKKKIWNEEMI